MTSFCPFPPVLDRRYLILSFLAVLTMCSRSAKPLICAIRALSMPAGPQESWAMSRPTALTLALMARPAQPSWRRWVRARERRQPRPRTSPLSCWAPMTSLFRPTQTKGKTKASMMMALEASAVTTLTVPSAKAAARRSGKVRHVVSCAHPPGILSRLKNSVRPKSVWRPNLQTVQ